MKIEEQLKMLLIDTAETDTAIRDMCRDILTDQQIYGDSTGVPTLEDIVEKLIEKINWERMSLA